MNLRLWDNQVDQFIELPHGGPGAGFRLSELIAYVQSTGRGYIIQGQQNCLLVEHTKPNSLDVWLRKNYTSRQDTRQAVNQVFEALVATGYFERDDLPCPDSGRKCKALKLVNVSQD